MAGCEQDIISALQARKAGKLENWKTGRRENCRSMDRSGNILDGILGGSPVLASIVTVFANAL